MVNLDEIIMRHEAATHGEWGDLPHGYRTEVVYFTSDADGKRVGIPVFDTRANTKRADVLFVVYAHNHDIPALVAEVQLLEQQRARAIEELIQCYLALEDIENLKAEQPELDTSGRMFEIAERRLRALDESGLIESTPEGRTYRHEEAFHGFEANWDGGE